MPGSLIWWAAPPGCERLIEHALTGLGLRDCVTQRQRSYPAIIYHYRAPDRVFGDLVPGTDVAWLRVPCISPPDGAIANTVFEGKDLGAAVANAVALARNGVPEAYRAAKRLFELTNPSRGRNRPLRIHQRLL